MSETTRATRTEICFSEFAPVAGLVKNSFVPGPENSNEPKYQPQASAPDGGLNDGRAAIAVLVLVIVLIIVAIVAI
jgi:hypothetical protein